MSELHGSVSVWHGTTAIPRRPRLESDLAVDVCVVGAGIAGLSTAYELAREGRRVAVLDRDCVAAGESGRTTAHLSNALDDRYFELEQLHGEGGARLAAWSHTHAIHRAEEIAAQEGLDAARFLRIPGYLFLAPEHDLDLLDKERTAALRAGVSGVELLPRAPIDSFESGPCLVFPRQGQFHPLGYLNGLAEAIERRGGMIFDGTNVTEVEDGPPAAAVTANGRRVTADAVVVATDTPFVDRVRIHTKQASYRTYVVGFRISPGAYPAVLLWDTGDPYHYVRTEQLGDGSQVLIVGGEDHKTGQEQDQEERLARLEAWTRARFPVGETAYRWSGQILEPVDSLALIGRNPGEERVYVVTGDSGHGMTHGIFAGMLLRDLILGRHNPAAELYDASRKTLGAAGEWTKENVNAAAQYADWVTAGEVESVDEVPAGEGRIVRRGVRKVAVYRDADGRLHERSAVCTHLGGVVCWNPLERSWDCPVHGSRFAPDGRVLNGPAATALGEAEAEKAD